MEYIFIAHAGFRILKRKINDEEVIDAIKSPDKISKKHGKYYAQKKLSRGKIELYMIKQKNI